MVLIKNLTQTQINSVVDNFKGEVITNADTNKLMFNTGNEFTYLVYSDLNNIITGLAGVEATNLTGTLQTAAQPNVTTLGTLTGLTVNNNLSVAQHNGIDKGLTLGGELVTSSAEQLNYVNTTPGTAEANKALVLDEDMSIVGLSNLETDNLTVNGTLVTSSAIELNYVDVDTLGVAQASKALVVDADRNITNINTLEADFIQVNGTLVTSSAIELNYVDVETLGTAQASKALVVDANRNISNLNDVSAVNLTGTIQTAAQPNITSLGDLTGLNVDGVASVDSLIVNGVPLDAFKTDSLKIRVYSTADFNGRVIKADIIPTVDFTNYEPVAGMTENYSMEIWGYIKPIYSESYTFTINSNDKFRLWINNELVKYDWTEGDDTNLQTNPIALSAGQWYPIYIQHSQLTGTERLSVRWSSSTQVSEVLPANCLAYDDKNLPVVARKLYTQDSISLYDSVNTTVSSLSVNSNGDMDITSASNNVNISGHNGSSMGLKLNNVLVTSTAAELNYVDTTVGVAAANKAVVLNADKDYTGVRNITTIGNMGVNTSAPSKQVEINSSTGDVLRLARDAAEGSAVNYADMTIDADGKLTINSSGDETIIHSSDNFNIAGHNGSSVGLKLNNILVTATANELNYVDTTAGTAEASKALVVNSSRDISNINILSTSKLTSLSTDDSTSVSTGAITTAGGVGIAKSVNVGGTVKVLDTTNATSASTGALVVAGGAGVKKALYVGEEGASVTTSTTTGGTPLGTNWTDITPSNVSKVDNAWLGTAWSETNNRFVVVGSSIEGNNILHSADGSSWSKVGVGKSVVNSDILQGTPIPSVNESQSWLSTAWNGSMYVSVGGGQYAMTSTDGNTWTQTTIGSGIYLSVTYAADLSLFVAVGNASNIKTSPDGITWTTRNAPAGTHNYNSVCWSEDLQLLVAVGQGTAKIITSSDGITWTSRSTSSIESFSCVTWAGGSIQRFIACSTADSIHNVITSTDGINWPIANLGISNTRFKSVAWSVDLDKIVLLNWDPAGPLVVSSNGTTWSSHTSPGGNSIIWSYYLNRFIAVGTGTLSSSVNGTTWLSFNTGVESRNWLHIAEGPYNNLVAVTSTGTNRVLKITTGTTVDVAQSEMFDVAYASGMSKYVAIGRYSYGPSDNFFHAATSTDGTSWTYHENATTVDAGTSAIYYNTSNLQMAYSSTLNRLVVVGTNVILTSTNGTTWTESRISAKPFVDVIWAGGSVNKFVAIGEGGLYSTSSDGINWTHNIHSSEELFETIAYSPTLNKFILKGLYNSYSSIDANTFTLMQTIDELPIPNLDGGRWSDMQWVDEVGQFVAVGYAQSKSLVTSSDGITWTSYTGIPNIDYEDFIYAPALNKMIAVSRNDENVRIVQSTWTEGITTTTTTTTPANGYFNLKGKADIIGGIDVEGVVNMNNTTQSTSISTGALVVDGGVGIAKTLNVGESLDVNGDAALGANVSIDGPSLKIPVGNTAARPTGQLGQIRYNNETSQFEGFGAGNSWGSLGGVTDVDQDTKILAETAAGDDNDELRFYNAGSESMRLTNVGLLGLGTSAPSKKLEINSSTGDVLRMTYNDSDGSAVNYADMTISSDGKLTINSSGNETIIHSSDNFNIAGHDGSTLGLKLNNVLVTATAAELNYVDTTQGTAEASKALVVNSSRNISNINNLSMTGSAVVTGTATTSGLVLSSSESGAFDPSAFSTVSSSASASYIMGYDFILNEGVTSELEYAKYVGNTYTISTISQTGIQAYKTANGISSVSCTLSVGSTTIARDGTVYANVRLNLSAGGSNAAILKGTSNGFTSVIAHGSVSDTYGNVAAKSSTSVIYSYNSKIYYSLDGSTFSEASGVPGSGITWSNGTIMYSHELNMYIVAGGAGIWTSPTGQTWTQASTPTNSISYVYHNRILNKAFAYSISSNTLLQSSDGLTWTSVTLPALGGMTFGEAINNNHSGVFAIYPSNPSTSKNMLYTLDGTTWQTTLLTLSNNEIPGVGFMFVRNNGAVFSNNINHYNANNSGFKAYKTAAIFSIAPLFKLNYLTGGYLANQSKTGYQWYSSSTDASVGNKIMELDSELSMTVSQSLENTTDSSSTTTGALKVAGGVGIAKSVNVGQNLNVDGNVDVDGPSLRIPVGSTSDRPVGQLGQIRYNNETSQFEGFGAGNSWGSLGGVSDVDQDTKILAETAAGDDNDELRFYNAGSESMRLTNVGLLGLGTSAPAKKLEINSATGDVLRMTYNDADGSAVNYVDMTVSESGNLTINSIGETTFIKDTNNLDIAGHNGSTVGLKLAGVLVTATAEEINYVDTTTGTAEASKALVLNGDRDISNINILSSSKLTAASTEDSTSISTGAITTAGGVGIAKNLNVGGIHKITNLTNSTSSDSGALVVNGGAGIKKALFVGDSESVDGYFKLFGIADITGNANIEGIVNANNTTDSTSSTTGAVVVDGGVGIAKSVNIGQTLTVSGNSTLSANVVVDGPSLRIPVGDTTARPVGVLGQIRYNSETSQFEGFGAGNSWGSLGGVTDVDQDTRISAETAAGDDNDELRFYNAGNETMRLTNVGLMGLGTSAPAKKLEINSATGDVLRLTYDDADGSAANFVDMNVSSDGKLTINSSGDETIIHSSDSFNIAGHNGSTIGLKLNNVLVTATAAELNYVDTTAGTAEASKALVLNADRDISNINVLSADTINTSTFSAQDLTAENINTTGNVGINTSDLTYGLQINHSTGNVLRLTYNDNSGSAPTSKADFTMDDSNNLTINAANSVNVAVHNGTDKGLKLNGVLITSTAAELNYVDTTQGVAEASKALVLNSSKDITGINSISMNSLNLTFDSAVADTQGNPLTITRTTSGTPANGLGVGMKFQIENSANANVEYGNVGVVATDITAASEDGNFVVNLMTGGVMTECLRLSKENLYVESLWETSDRRAKENFEEVSLHETYDNIMNLKLTKYNYIGQDIIHTGLIAQEVEEIIPAAVNIENRNGIEDFRSVSNREITNTLLGAVQFLAQKLESLTADFEAYKSSHP